MRRFYHIALRIALEEETGASRAIVALVSDEAKEAMGIPLDAQPFAEGVSSAVYENSKGNIVSFLPEEDSANFAKKLMGKDSTVLPAVHRVEEVEVVETPEYREIREERGQQYVPRHIFAIEMEKLQVLDQEEKSYIKEILEGHSRGIIESDRHTFLDDYVHEDMKSELREKLEADPFGQAILDLFEKLRSAKLYHGDLKLENIAWTPHGTLKVIDFGAISDDVFEESVRSSMGPFPWSTHS